MTTTPYRLTLPEQRLTSVVFASPHSGRAYPAAFLARSILDQRTIRTSEDAFVDDLLDIAPHLGAPLLAASAPRAYLDLNRAADELDPALIEGVRAAGHNPRVSSGLGVVPRVVAGSRAIYRGKMALAEAEARIAAWWRPYHRQLQTLMSESHAEFGEAILIDMHSMPHEALDSLSYRGSHRPEIVLGDRFGASASSTVIDQIEAAFAAEGLRVVRNAPFAGAYIAQTYGRPSIGHHAVQIEIDRALYMDEAKILPNENFNIFKETLGRILTEIAQIGRMDVQLAAE